ncbi:MAG: Uma2 family endonuclease [Deltaproteobacteria bacterium]|nr:Uma2 family endonuclease [Deltaproteobacteria bacterium]
MTQAQPAESGVVDYPESDGKPMGETDVHRIEMQSYLIEVLEDFFAKDVRVYVSGNNFIYYVEGDPTESVSPDVYVVFGVPKRTRRVFKVWEEGSTPRVVFEVTSTKTRHEDRGSKLSIYAELGVREVYLFDPFEEWVKQGLRAFRLEGDGYLPVIPSDGRVSSKALELDLGVVEGHLRFFEPATRMMLPTRLEAKEAADQRAEAEKQRAEAEKQRAEAEKQRAEAALQRVAELEAELARVRG